MVRGTEQLGSVYVIQRSDAVKVGRTSRYIAYRRLEHG